MTKEEYWFWLCNINGLYQPAIEKLMSVYADPEEIYKSSEEQILATGAVSPKQAHEIMISKNNYRSIYKLDKLKKDGIRFVYYGSEEYPETLAMIPDKPFSLYVKGKLPDPDFPSCGIIGARKCSGYGREMTMRFSQTLASCGIQIISGMALGIDTCASRGALEAGGRTFVILGSGIDVIYPPQNIELYYQIIMNNGGVISEYPQGTPPVGWQFPHRNRLISALSDKLLVMEARNQSGTLTTVSFALAQGKDVYALPGRITDPVSEGCNKLIADGAGVLLDPGQLAKELTGRIVHPGYAGNSSERAAKAGLSGPQEAVWKALDYTPKMTDQIAAECGMEISGVSRILAELELSGLCVQAGQDYYAIGSADR